MANQHPYRSQPPRAFWRQSISPMHPLDIADWYEPKFSLSGARIATAGSCFAQHIGRNLRQTGFHYIDAEPAPEGLDPTRHLDFGYGMYSARYGNVYTSRQLLQLARRALEGWSPDGTIWEHKGGVVDAFRPTIEPEPFGSTEELERLRSYHLDCVADLLTTADVFVFTLGLTEAWESRVNGAVFPLCPGTAGGTFDPAHHALRNLTAAEVLQDMEDFIALVRRVNPTLRLFLTVSPVPLMATATRHSVAVASSYSKAVLRAVAGQLSESHDFIDYFPSYEIISSPVMRGMFFNPDGRDVSRHGVNHVMKTFFAAHPPPETGSAAAVPSPQATAVPLSERAAALDEEERVKCDEEILQAFGKAQT